MKRKFNTIKFKLTLWFGALILFASLSSILVLNSVLIIDRNRPAPHPDNYGYQNTQLPMSSDDFELRVQQEKEALQAKVFLVSTFLIVFQVLFASLSSYFVIKRMLAPLEQLNNLMKDVNEKVLYTQLKFDGKSEELNELVSSFNDMMRRLEKAFEGQKQFVQNVSHEIKTPLTIIKTNLEALLLDKTPKKDEIDSYVKTSIESINNLNNLTEDLLLLSLLDKGKIYSKKESINLLLLNVVNDLQKVALKRNMEIVFEGKSKKKIYCNSTLLKRAFSNIIENSIKYADSDTEIKVKLSENNDKCIITIEDNGSGIPKELLEKIFDRFFRADNSRSRESGGAGIGLAITKEIIELMKGKIEFTNLEHGLKAVITLPTI